MSGNLSGETNVGNVEKGVHKSYGFNDGGAPIRSNVTPGGHALDQSQPAFPDALATQSLCNVKAHGVSTPNVVVGLALFYGGLVQILAGMWEFAVGNTFGATAFSSYGGFWMSAAEFEHAIGFFLFGWMIFTFIMWIASLRSSVALSGVFFFLTITFLLLGVSYFVPASPGIGTAGGVFGLITAFNAWSKAKLDETAALIKAESPEAKLRQLLVDLSSLESVRKAAAEVNSYSEAIDKMGFSDANGDRVAGGNYHWKTIQEGASTQIVAAFDPTITAESGSYLDNAQLANAATKPYALDKQNAEKLWALSEKMPFSRTPRSRLSTMAPPKRYFDKDSSPDKKNFKERDDREPKEKFKPKTGFIAAGLKQYTEAAEASALAKKEQLAEGWTDRTTTQTTLHLTHLPPSLTSPQLSILCSSYAPLRSAFVVSTSFGPTGAPTGTSSANAVSTGAGRDRTGKSTSRGFGYVRFVLRTDADKCLEEWGTPTGIPRSAVKELEDAEGMENVEWDKVCGRNGIKMAWAKKKLKEGEEPESKPKTKAARPAKVDEPEKPVREKREWIDYDAEGAPPRPGTTSRTIILQGVPIPLTDEERAAKKARKEAAAAAKMDVDGDAAEEPEEEAEDADVDEETGKPVDWKKVIRQKARKAGDVEDVQWPVLLPSGESVATIIMPTPRLAHELMKKLHNHVFRGLVVTAAVKSSWDLVQRLGRGKGGGRLVVRNLSFDTTIADLRTVFAKYGSLHSITLPLDGTTAQPRGFAFVYYISKSSAEAALAAVNGTRIYAGLAKERVMSEGGKGGKKKEVREQKKRDEKDGGGGGGEKGRVVAVDWALGKDEYKKAQVDEEKAAVGDESGSEGSEDGSEGSEEESEEEEEEDDDSDLEPIAMGASDDESEKHADDDDDELDEEPQAPEPPKGTTLFVRNMSFEATEAELYDLFKAFGPVRYARIVFDPTTKRSRGTAFVCFWNDEDAQKVLQASGGLNAGLFGETSNKKEKNQSLLMADPGTSGAAGLTLHGRVLAAVAAVSKDDADKLREDRDKKGAAQTDRRNLYLMREGVIFPSWAIAQTLHPADLAARQASFDARKGLLRSNPSLYISRTRLSVRQIPLYVSDGMMKRLANYAMKEFEKEVKLGHQKALTADEKNNTVQDASGIVPPSKTERFKGVPPSRVRQAKILRQTDRVDPLTGLGRSKGYGFLELGSHADALRVLRWANANKDVGALFRGWWRETLEKLIEKEESAEGPKAGKGVSAKDRAERAKRLKEKMAELVEEEDNARGKAAKREGKGKAPSNGEGRNAKCLIIEFSIENQVTTKRRADKADRSRERAKRSKARVDGESDSDDSDAEGDEEAAAAEPTKKRKASQDDSSTKKKVKVANETKQKLLEKEGGEAGDEGKSKLWTGSIIGKKRRQKSGKK
ncbi:hypothetical protein RQP46_000326 [Phenoliferia psychrophenolica]